MLLDCDLMKEVWPYPDAQRGQTHERFREAVHATGLWDSLLEVWNADAGEYVTGKSKLVRFTASKTQPWRICGRPFRRRSRPSLQRRTLLEREADAARFTTFTKERPSLRLPELVVLNQEMHQHGAGGGSKPPEDVLCVQRRRSRFMFPRSILFRGGA